MFGKITVGEGTPEPAEPEKEGADELEGRGVPIEVPGAFEAASPRAEHRCAHLAKGGVRVTARNDGLGWGLEEGAERARAGVGLEDGSSHQRREAAGHVHHAGAGEVDHTAHYVVLVEGGEEARAIPHPVHHDRIDEARDAERVDEVRHKLAALGHGARHDSCRRRAEGVVSLQRGSRMRAHLLLGPGSAKRSGVGQTKRGLGPEGCPEQESGHLERWAATGRCDPRHSDPAALQRRGVHRRGERVPEQRRLARGDPLGR